MDKGTLMASSESGESKTLFFLVPIGLRQVAIQNIDTLAYIAMNEASRVYLSEVYNSDCQFKEATFENYWCVYSSVSHKNPDNTVRLNDFHKFQFYLETHVSFCLKIWKNESWLQNIESETGRTLFTETNIK